MASQLQRIKELISAYEDFLETHPEDDSVDGFLDWSKGAVATDQEAFVQVGEYLDHVRNQNRQLLTLKRALKPFVQASPFSGLDDYYLLLEVQEKPGLLKKDLIASVGLEYSTGVEVVARLKKRALLRESFAPGDKRSRLVELTAKGASAVTDFTKSYEEIASSIFLQ